DLAPPSPRPDDSAGRGPPTAPPLAVLTLLLPPDRLILPFAMTGGTCPENPGRTSDITSHGRYRRPRPARVRRGQLTRGAGLGQPGTDFQALRRERVGRGQRPPRRRHRAGGRPRHREIHRP